MVNFGDACILFALASSGAALLIYILIAVCGSNDDTARLKLSVAGIAFGKTIISSFSNIAAAAVLCSNLYLLKSFIDSDFRILNVFQYSSNIKPMALKIAGLWASHQGSMLLWLSIVALFILLNNLLVNRYAVKKFGIPAFSDQPLLLNLFLLAGFVYFKANPFVMNDNLSAAQGLGLSPALQDHAMVFHPPILYIGFVGTVWLFSLGINLLWSGEVSVNQKGGGASLLHRFQLWCFFHSSRIIWSILLLGLAWGSSWAYRELGWGGFWSFDPIENAGLLPFLALTIVIHFNNKIKVNYRYVYCSAVLSVCSYLLALFATFCTRSGLIQSVHSFSISENSAIYIPLILLFLLIYFIVNTYVYANSAKNKPVSSGSASLLHNSMKWLLLIISALVTVIVISLLMPIYSYLYNIFSVSEDFIIFTMVPILIVMMLVMSYYGFGKVRAMGVKIYDMILSFGLSALVLLVIMKLPANKIAAEIYDNYFILKIIVYLVGLQLFIYNMAGAINKYWYVNKVSLMNLSHAVIGLMAVSIAHTGLYSSQYNFDLKIGGKQYIAGTGYLHAENCYYSSYENYYKQVADLKICNKNGDEIAELRPEIRFYKVEKSFAAKASVDSFVFNDYYAVLTFAADGKIVGILYHKPAINLMWLCILMLVLLGLVSKSGNFMAKNWRASKAAIE